MSKPEPTSSLRATRGDGDGVHSGPSSRPRPGLWHDLARWSLAHPKLVTTLAVLGLVAFCGWNVWAAFHQAHAWTIRHGDGSVPDDLRDRTSVMLAGLLGWIFLATVVVHGKLKSMKWSGWDSLSFNARLRERILRGAPIRSGVLLAYTLFALIGLGIGLALVGQALSLLPWLGSPAAKTQDHSISAAVLALFVIVSAARLLWQILIQAEWDDVIGDRRAEIAEAILRSEEAGRDEEREEKRTSVGVWCWAVLIVGFAGGMWLSSRLPEPEQNLCVGSGLSGLVAAGFAVYVAGTKPRGSAAWLALVALLFAAALVYHWHAFEHPTGRSLLLGVTGGVTVGGTFAMLYLKQIRRHLPSDVQSLERK